MSTYQAKQESSGQNEVNPTDSYTEIISALARTRSEANILLGELDVLLRSLYKTGQDNFDATLAGRVRARTANAISLAVVGANTEVVLKNLKNKIEALNYLGLTIAFDPNLETIGRLYLWVKQNLGDGVAIDLKIEKSILGGAIIEYKGKIRSFTILTAVDNYFLNNNANF